MKNDDKKYWMKRRRYGWGWTPTTKRGWLFIVSQVLIIFAAALMLPTKPNEPTTFELIGFFVIVALVIISLFMVTSDTAPKARWRWGKKDTDNPDEDF